MAHFLLRDPDSPNLVSRIEKQGRGTFMVKPTSMNEGLVPITGKATVDIMGKKTYISLVHKVKEEEDPEPSVPKWSYFTRLYSNYNPLTAVSEAVAKTMQLCYLFNSAGNITYSGTPANINSSTTIKIGYQFTTDAAAKNSISADVAAYEKYDTDNQYFIGSFRMYYKAPYIDPNTGDPVIPTDDDTPASHRERLPCNAAISNIPSFITNATIKFLISTTDINNHSIVNTNVYNDWASFRSAWEAARVNTVDYYDVNFEITVYGKVNTNSGDLRDFSPIVIQEIAGDDSKIWGAKVLTLYIGQAAGYKMIKLYYKKAESNEVTVPGSGGVYPVTAQSPGMAQVSNNHKLWFNGEPCSVYNNEFGDDIITVSPYVGTTEGKITGRGKTDAAGQDYLNLEYEDSSKNRQEYFYVGNPFFLGFVEETNLYKEQVGINLYDSPNAHDFWHSLYFTGIDEKCSYDPEWYNVLSVGVPHIFQGGSPYNNLGNAGYTILIPWAVKSGNSWKSLYEIPTAYTNSGLTENSHRILAIDWVDRAANGDPGLSKDTVKSTTDVTYGGGVTITAVNGRDKTDGTGWKFNPDKVSDGSGVRLKNYLEYVLQQWDNNPTAFGSPTELRSVKEILFVPMFVTGHKICPSNMINNSNINAMCYGFSLLPEAYKNHQGYAKYIGIFPPKITGWY